MSSFPLSRHTQVCAADKNGADYRDIHVKGKSVSEDPAVKSAQKRVLGVLSCPACAWNHLGSSGRAGSVDSHEAVFLAPTQPSLCS